MASMYNKILQRSFPGVDPSIGVEDEGNTSTFDLDTALAFGILFSIFNSETSQTVPAYQIWHPYAEYHDDESERISIE